MFIQSMPENEPTGYRKEIADWLRQTALKHTILEIFGAGSLQGLALATGVSEEKWRSLPMREAKLAQGIWLESVLFSKLKGYESTEDFFKKMKKVYGVY
jgi:hypothetical protein